MKILIEIDDKTHEKPDRIERDERLKMICRQINIPLVRFKVSKGVQEWYIRKRFKECGLDID